MATQQQPGAMGMAQYAAADGDQQKRRRKEGGAISSQLGGPVNYAFFSVWLALGFSGWIIGCAGLSALQRYENHSGISVLGGAGWAVKSNYPALDSGRVFRLDWFDLFLNFIVLMLIVVALFTKVIHQTRIVIVGWLAAATVLAIFSADRFYNFSHWHLSSALWASSRATFSGFLINATANFALMYHLGIIPPPPPRQPVKEEQVV